MFKNMKKKMKKTLLWKALSHNIVYGVTGTGKTYFVELYLENYK